jgi:hypothetical protein
MRVADGRIFVNFDISPTNERISFIRRTTSLAFLLIAYTDHFKKPSCNRQMSLILRRMLCHPSLIILAGGVSIRNGNTRQVTAIA